MYLAPLNYDRYFKKVFSNLDIAKKFLEDFLDVEIEEIEAMPVNHKVTDDSVSVEFDFRCKIGGSFVIIDMQQWYKPDVVYRFYTYHCLNTALQLENLPIKRILLPNGKIRKVKDYSGVMPVITIIWMVEDNLGFKQDYISYSMLPEKSKNFFEETHIWNNQDIEDRIKEILKIYSNNTKDLSFLQKNRLLFAFQKNIVRNDEFSKYSVWFKLAEKTLNKLNKKSDFDEYTKDQVFIELMRRLLKSKLTDEDLQYIEDYEQIREEVERYNQGIWKEGKQEGRQEGIQQEKKRSEIVIKQAEKLKEEAEQKAEQANKEKEQVTKKLENTITGLYKQNFTIEQITELTDEDTEKVVEILKKHKLINSVNL